FYSFSLCCFSSSRILALYGSSGILACAVPYTLVWQLSRIPLEMFSSPNLYFSISSTLDTPSWFSIYTLHVVQEAFPPHLCVKVTRPCFAAHKNVQPVRMLICFVLPSGCSNMSFAMDNLLIKDSPFNNTNILIT